MFKNFKILYPFRAPYIAIVFLLACSIPFYAANLPSIKILQIILFLVGIFILFKRSNIVIYLFIFFAVLTNFVYQAEQHQNNRLDFQYAKKQFLINTKIIDFPKRSIKNNQVVMALKVKLVADVIYNEGDSDESIILSKNSVLKITCYRCEEIFLLGEEWQFNTKLKPPRGLASWGAFDYEKYAFANQIVATGYFSGKAHKKIIKQQSILGSFRQKIHQTLVANSLTYQPLAETTSQKNSELLDDNDSKKDNLALLLALIVGDRTQLKAEHWEIFRNTGTSHLMSISGLHITLVFFLINTLTRIILSMLLRFLPTTISRLFMEQCFYRVSLQTTSMILALAAAILYAYVAGFSLPTQRAILMLTIFCFAHLYMKKLSLFEALSVAVIVLLLFSPLSTLQSGFWLSILAVLMIAVLIKSRETKWLLQCRMALAMIPLTILFFSDAPLISPIANLLLIPLIAMLLLPLALFMSFLSFCVELTLTDVESMAYLLNLGWQLVNVLIDIVWYLLRLFSDWQASAYEYFPVSIPSSNLARLLTVIFVCMILMWRLTFARKLWVLPMLAFLLIAPEHDLEEGEFSVTTLDVGQGLAIIIETPSHYVAFDTGVEFLESDSAEGIIIPFLKHGNRKPLSHIIVSHADKDHIGGLPSLHNFSPSTPILIGGIANAEVSRKLVESMVIDKNKLSSCYEKKWQLDGVNFQVLPIPIIQTAKQKRQTKQAQSMPLKRNDKSCVLKVSSRYGSALLPGDIERQTEHYLAKHFPREITADVLIAAHHGSRTSSTPVFLDAVKADFSIISAAYFSPYGHPHANVLKRLQKKTKNVLSTAHSGSIKINFLKDGIHGREYRALHPRFWYSQNVN